MIIMINRLKPLKRWKTKVIDWKERARKEKEPKKEKQKEIVKQAIFNKVIATAEIALNLAKNLQ
jgi:hypothetical protein